MFKRKAGPKGIIRRAPQQSAEEEDPTAAVDFEHKTSVTKTATKAKLSFDESTIAALTQDASTMEIRKKPLRQSNIAIPEDGTQLLAAAVESTSLASNNENGIGEYSAAAMQRMLESQRKSTALNNSINGLRQQARELANTTVIPSIIPEASEILAARKKREMLREYGEQSVAEVEGEFIPLEQSASVRGRRRGRAHDADGDSDLDDSESNGSKEGDGAITRQEDDDVLVEGFAEDYFDSDNRLAFGPAAMRELHQKQRREMQTAFREAGRGQRMALDENGDEPDDYAEDEEEEDEDETVLEWERQQILKGAKSANRRQSTEQRISELLAIPRKSLRIPQPIPLPTFDDALTGLEQQLRLWQEDYQENFSGLEMLMKARSAEETTLSKTEAEIQVAGEKYNYFQDLQHWMDNFVGWMNEKVPAVSECESDYFESLYQQAERRLQERTNTINSLLEFSFNLDSEAQQLVEACLITQQPSAASTPWKTFDSNIQFLQELSGDSRWKDRLLAAFIDTDEAFIDIRKIIERFVQWYQLYQRDYFDAYVSLSLPGVLEVFIRRSLMLDWNPIGSGGDADGDGGETQRYKDLDRLEWHQLLVNFHSLLPAANADEMMLDDATERQLTTSLHEALQKICEKFIIPFLRRSIKQDSPAADGASEYKHGGDRSAFDPFSGRQCYFLVRAIENISDYFDDGEDTKAPAGFRTLLELLAARCRAVVRQTREHFIIPEITGFGGDEGNLMMFSKQLQAWSAAFNSNYQLLYNMQTMGRQLSVQYQSILPENLSFWELIELRPLLTDVLLPTVSIGFDQMMLAVTNKDAAQQFVETIASMLEKLLQSGFSDSPAVSSKPVAGSGSGEWEIMQSLLRRIHQLADSYGLQDHLPSTII